MDNLVEYLTLAISSNKTDRQAAENYFINLQERDDYAVLLLFTIGDAGVDSLVKLVAAVMLKNYIKNANWDRPERRVKSNIIPLMMTSPKAVRKQLSEAVALMANGWQNHWPNLIADLAMYLSGNDIHNANSALETAHLIFRRYRHECASHHLWKEIELVLDVFAKPLTKSLQITMEILKKTPEDDVSLLTDLYNSIILIMQIFYSLNYHDLTDHFELDIWMKTYRKIVNNEIVLQTSVGLMAKMQSKVFDTTILFALKYREDFEQYWKMFAYEAVKLYRKMGNETKYVVLKYTLSKFVTTAKNRYTRNTTWMQSIRSKLFHNAKCLTAASAIGKEADVAKPKRVFSTTTFGDLNLNPDISVGLCALSVTLEPVLNRMTKTQEKLLLPMTEARNLVVTTKPADGSTLALAIIMTNKVDSTRNCAQAFYVASTVESAIQFQELTTRLGIFENIKVEIVSQNNAPRCESQILVGTKCEILLLPDTSQMVLGVFDDADLTLQSQQMIDFVNHLHPTCQIIGLSSSSNKTWQKNIASGLALNISVVDPFYKLRHYFITCTDFQAKVTAIDAVYSELRPRALKAIIFCPKEEMIWLKLELLKRNIDVCLTNGDLPLSQRVSELNAFEKSGEAGVMIASNCFSRGINIPKVAVVINFNVPAQQMLYYYRATRVCQFSSIGQVITLTQPQSLQTLQTHSERLGIRCDLIRYV